MRIKQWYRTCDCALTLLPASIRILATFVVPASAAVWSGVLPFWQTINKNNTSPAAKQHRTFPVKYYFLYDKSLSELNDLIRFDLNTDTMVHAISGGSRNFEGGRGISDVARSQRLVGKGEGASGPPAGSRGGAPVESGGKAKKHDVNFALRITLVNAWCCPFYSSYRGYLHMTFAVHVCKQRRQVSCVSIHDIWGIKRGNITHSRAWF